MKHCYTYLINYLCKHLTLFIEHISLHAMDTAVNKMDKCHALMDPILVGRADDAQNKYLVDWMVLDTME